MAKKKRKYRCARRGFLIPWDAVERIFRLRRFREFDALRHVILTCGASFTEPPEGFKIQDMRLLVSIGWLRWVEGQKRWYQVKLSSIFPRAHGTQRHWHGHELLGKDVRAVLYKLQADYLSRPQAVSKALQDRPATRRGGVEKTRLLHTESPECGGVAHSLFTKSLGISLGYSAKLRRLCESEGLADFEERVVSTQWDTALEGHVMGDKRFLFNGYGGAWAQLTSLYKPRILAEMRVDIGEHRHGCRKIFKRDYRQECNFHHQNGPFSQ